MKIAFVYSSYAITPNGGVRIQAMMWKEGLERLGDSVILVSPFYPEKWELIDAMVIFGYSPGCRNLIKDYAKVCKNVFIAPIIDPSTPDYIYKFLCKYWGCQKFLGLSSRFHDLWLARTYPKTWLVRSKEEEHFVNYCLEIPKNKIVTVPLHYRIPFLDVFPQKENFCLHVSRLDSPNKNVVRLITAAKEFGFNLKLAGPLMGESGRRWLDGLTSNCSNIEYLGVLSETELQNMYKRAKVFALPSLQEGVGMVALEAAAYGCEIVLTNYGAPKEYYDGQAILVNPKSVVEIGNGVLKALDQGFSQPELKKRIDSHYNERACCQLLHNVLQS